MKNPFLCGRIDCTRKATKRPILSFASKVDPTGPRVVFQYPVLVCDVHASVDPNIYIDNDGWENIKKAMRHNGKAAPDRSTLAVSFEPMFKDGPSADDIFLWPDGTNCFRHESSEYGFMGDDYTVLVSGSAEHSDFLKMKDEK